MGDFILETVEKEHNRMALNVAALAGDILLASGAEIFRVEETINRIAHAYGIDSCDPFVLSSGFFLTADSNSDQNFAWVRHIPLSATRLDRVTAVNQLSREIEHGFYTPEEAYQKLQDIQQMPAKRNLCQILASGVGSGCFCYLFGGRRRTARRRFHAAGLSVYRRTAAVCLSAVRGERTAFQNRNEYIRWHVCDFHRRPDLSVGTWTSSE